LHTAAGGALKCNLNQTESVIDSLSFKNLPVVLFRATADGWCFCDRVGTRGLGGTPSYVIQTYTYMSLASAVITMQELTNDVSRFISLCLRPKSLGGTRSSNQNILISIFQFCRYYYYYYYYYYNYHCLADSKRGT
jgi:hypothetical protein